MSSERLRLIEGGMDDDAERPDPRSLVANVGLTVLVVAGRVAEALRERRHGR